MRSFFSFLLLFLLCPAVPAIRAAPDCGGYDTHFALANGTNGTVLATVVKGTDIFVGGTFTAAGNVNANNVAKFDTLTNTWSALGNGGGNGVSSTVQTLAVIGNDLYVGGNFTSANVGGITVNASSVAKVNLTTGVWSALGGGTFFVQAMVANGSDLYLGGGFTSVNGGATAANYVVKYDTLTGAWSTVGTGGGNGVNNTVYALAIIGGDLYAGGTFTSANTGGSVVSTSRVAKVNMTTGVWSALGTAGGNGVDFFVWTLTANGNNLYVGGDFAVANSGGTAQVDANRVARYDTGTGLWSALGTGFSPFRPGLDSSVQSIAVVGNDVYVGGKFTTGRNNSISFNANYLARFNTSTSTWSALGTGGGNGVNNTVYALAVVGNNLYAGGELGAANIGGTNVVASRVVKFDTTSSAWNPLGANGGNGLNGIAYAVVTSGTDVYVGGDFGMAGSAIVNRVAKFDKLTNTWSSLGTGGGSGVNGTVNSLLLIGSDLYVGGAFTSANVGGTTVTANRIAKFNTTTGVWSAVGSSGGNGLNNTVRALLAIGTDLYAGGDFTIANSGANVAANRVAKVDTTTGVWSSLGTSGGNGVDNLVYALAADGTKLFVGGNFLNANAGANVAANRVAKYDSTTNTWSTLGTGAGNGVTAFAASVRALAVAGGSLFVGGSFDTANAGGVTLNTNNIARVNLTSGAWSALGGCCGGGVITPGQSIAPWVYALAVNGNDLYVGGNFIPVDYPNNISTNRLAKYSILSNAWSVINDTAGGYGTNGGPLGSPVVNALGMSGTSLFVGGAFTVVGDNKPAVGIAQICNSPPIIATSGPLTRQQGTSATNSTIANVNDALTSPNNLSFTVTSTPSGITVTNVVNTNGVVTANISASCAAAPGDNAIALQVSDGSLAVAANVIVNVTTTEINVKGNGVSIVDGSTTPGAGNFTDFSLVAVANSNLTRTYTIENSGTGALHVSGITLSGANSFDFAIGGITFPATVNAGSSTTFTVKFDPSSAGLRTATVQIANDDCDESPYDFAIQGTSVDADYNVTTSGGAIVITNVVQHSETLSFSEPSPGQIKLSASGRVFLIDNNSTITGDGGNLPLSGMTSITLNAGAGNSVINLGGFTTVLPSLTINGDAGDDTVNFNGSITFAANANLDLNLQNDTATPGIDSVNLAAGAQLTASGTGTIDVNVSKNVSLGSGARLQTADGNLAVRANQQTTASTNDFIGVALNGGSLKTTGAGTITVLGKGGNAANNQFGVAVKSGGAITSTGGGAISITGTGGAGSGTRNVGVRIDSGGSITSAGSGSITISGTSGSGSSDDYGVSVDGLNTGGTAITSVNGDISITGVSLSATGTDQDGVRFENSTGSQATAVNINGAGLLTITGTAGNFVASSSGINLVDDTTMTVSGASTTFIADTMDLGTSNVSVNAGANAVTLKVRTANHAILLGSADTSSSLGLTDAELDRFTCSTLNLGDTVNTSAMSITAAITRAAATNINLFVFSGTAQGIVFGSSIDSAGGNIKLNASPFGFTPGPGVDASMGTTGTLSFSNSSRFNEPITSATVDTGYKQLTVVGKLDLTGVPLQLSGSMTISSAVTFTIVSNDGTDPITGTFSGLPEGSILNNFLGSGKTAVISYVGGDGNDVTITCPSNAPNITAAPALSRQQGAAAINSIIATVSDPAVPAGNLVVTATSVPAGITVSNIVNTNGTVTANVAASCLAAPNSFVTLQASNGSLTNTASLLVIVDAPEINLKGNGVSIPDGALSPNIGNGTDYGTTPGATHTFTIENSGSIALSISNITVSGSNASDFIIGGITLPTTVNAGSSRTFTVKLAPGASEVRTATINIANDDCNEGAYDFAVQGVGASPAYSVTTTGGAIVVTDLAGNSDNLDISEPSPGFINFSSSGLVFSVNGSPMSDSSGDLPLGGVSSVTVNTGGGDDVVSVNGFAGSLPGLTIKGGSGSNTAYVGALSFAANANLTIDLQEDAGPSDFQYLVLYDAVSVSGTGMIDLRSGNSIEVDSILQTENGALTIEANQQLPSSSGSFSGVYVYGSIQSIGSGAITIKGRGGDMFGSNNGIVLYGGTIHGGAIGALTVSGTAGADPSGNDNIGVYLLGGAITSDGADLVVIGTGADSNGSNNAGVALDSGAQIMAGGSGKVTVLGNGGASSANQGRSDGVRVDTTDTKITSTDGDVSVTGNSYARASTFNWAVAVTNGASISAGGSGALKIAEDAGANQNDGVFIAYDGVVSAAGGTLTIDVAATAARGLDLISTGKISNPTGNITLIANKLDLQGPVDAGSNTVTLRQKSDGVAFYLGGNAVSPGILLWPAYLTNITCGTLNIGDNKSGPIVASQATVRPALTNVNLTSGDDIKFGVGTGAGNFVLDTAGGNLTVTPGTGHKVTVPGQQNDVNLGANGTLTFGNNPTLSILVNGTSSTQYDQLKIVGKVDLTGLGVAFEGTPTLTGSPTFIIVDNDGIDPIIGTFTGLPEGATIPNFLGSGRSATISYHGGDGNDVAVTVSAVSPAEIAVEQPLGTALTSSSSTIDFGNVSNGSSSGAKTLTIRNQGGASLTNIAVTKDGPGSADFSINTSGMSATVAGGNNTSFTVTFAPTAAGMRSAALHIASNDSDENPFNINLTGRGLSIAESWRQQYFNSPDDSGDGADGNDYDHDGLINLIERAFGTNPKVSQTNVVSYNGNTITPGSPTVMVIGQQFGVDYRALYSRRKDYVAAGLSYTVQFSSDLSAWVNSTATPTVMADDGNLQAVTVPYPLSINGRKPQFFRVVIEQH